MLVVPSNTQSGNGPSINPFKVTTKSNYLSFFGCPFPRRSRKVNWVELEFFRHISVCVGAEIKLQDMDCIYKDPNQPTEARIKDLVSKMTLKEKAGQMTQIERRVATHYVLKDLSIGTIDLIMRYALVKDYVLLSIFSFS